MKFYIKGKDILPIMKNKLNTIIEYPDKQYTVIWSKYAPNVISVDGFYTHFIDGQIENKEALLKSLSVM